MQGIDLNAQFQELAEFQSFGSATRNLLSIQYRQRAEFLRDTVGNLSEPKHGKVDPDNKPHVGGNTWAGGTGGRDTAGLGGVGA